MTEALILEDWLDCSNYGGVPSPTQVAAIHAAGIVGAVMGLAGNAQFPFVADKQKAAFDPALFFQEFFVDLPNRPIELCWPNSICWIDVEPNCFQDVGLIRAERDRLKKAGLRPGIYGNETSMAALGGTTEFSDMPLWYAHPGMVGAFKPFMGWTEMLMFQYTGTTKIQGFECDLNRRKVVPPTPPVGPTKTHQIDVYSDGSYRIAL